MPKVTSNFGAVGNPTSQTLAKHPRSINAGSPPPSGRSTPNPSTRIDVLEHCAGRLSYAHELAEQIRPLLLAIERLAEADHTIAGLANIGSETLDAVVADICGARDELNEQVRLAQRREFCDFVERSAS